MYIRTKDGRIYNLESKEVLTWEYVDDDTAINEYGVEDAFYKIYFFDKNECCRTFIIEEKDILAQADTIEELCDEFVLKTTSKESGKSYYGLYYYSDIKQFKVKEGFKGIWYGAIWTDKGLIYVAKMNDEGELVLI